MSRAIYPSDVPTCDVDVAADGAYLAEYEVVSRPAPSRVIEMTTGSEVALDELDDDVMRRLQRTSATGLDVAMSSFDSGLVVTDITTGQPVIDTGAMRVYSARFDPSGQRLALATFTGVTVWTLQEPGAPALVLNNGYFGPIIPCSDDSGSCMGGEILDVHWSPDGTRLLTDGLDDSVHVFDAGTGREIGRIGACLDVYRLSGWIDDSTVVVADGAGCVEVIRLP